MPRTLRIDERFTRRGIRITLSEIVDLKVGIQSMIANNRLGLKLDGSLYFGK
jgi:hypothetical protein